jgi:hypothetical protein
VIGERRLGAGSKRSSSVLAEASLGQPGYRRARTASANRGTLVPYVLAHTFADLVDWHALAALIERGCSPELALEIVR